MKFPKGLKRSAAMVVLRNEDRFLLLKRNKEPNAGRYVPVGGKLDPFEDPFTAAQRETLEETRWEVGLSAVLGIALYNAPNGNTYLRHTFLATPEREQTGRELDPDITATHWMTYEELLAQSGKMRSPLVLAAVEQHRKGICYPLDLIYGP